VGLALTDVIVRCPLSADSPITVVVDDTLFKRSGKKVFGAAWHHDGGAKSPKPIGFGNCWVVAGIVVHLPFCSRPVCLPVLARLWRPRRTGKLAHALQMAELIAARHPNRTVHVVGDAAYAGEQLRGLDGQLTWTSRLKVTSVLHALAPPRAGRSGRPRTKGERLGTPADLARTATWLTAQVRHYGRTDTVQIAEIICLWYGAFHTRTVRVVLVRDDTPRTRDGDDRGYGLPPVTTDLTSTAETLVARCAARWSIEVAFFDARQTLGVGQARNRTRQAVERTVPFGLICLSLVTVRYATAGHSPADTPDRRSRARWYTTKTEPSFDDMTTKLRRRPDRRQISALTPPPGNTRRSPDRPRSLGRRRNLTTKTAKHEGSGSLVESDDDRRLRTSAQAFNACTDRSSLLGSVAAPGLPHWSWATSCRGWSPRPAPVQLPSEPHSV
jgi:DDE superfamily endonuclease